MKILIYGAGVIGCTYGWQLQNAGNDITMMVRPGKAEQIEQDGIRIDYADYRNKELKTGKTIFRPKAIDKLDPDNDFDYIIVSVGSNNLSEVLPVLSQSAGKAHILFFQNVWDEYDLIAQYLKPGSYFFGFPFMAGGGRDKQGIKTIILGSKYSKTMLGEADGIATNRLQEMEKIMGKAGMKPFLSNQITTWLMPHYAFIAALSAGILKAGGVQSTFLQDKQQVKEVVKAIREGLAVCEAKGINPKKEKVNKLYYLPFLVCVPVMRKVFSDPGMEAMFNYSLQTSTTEAKYMLDKVIGSREKEGNTQIPTLGILRKNL